MGQTPVQRHPLMPVLMVIDWRSSRAPHTGLSPSLFDGLTLMTPCNRWTCLAQRNHARHSCPTDRGRVLGGATRTFYSATSRRRRHRQPPTRLSSGSFGTRTINAAGRSAMKSCGQSLHMTGMLQLFLNSEKHPLNSKIANGPQSRHYRCRIVKAIQLPPVRLQIR
jgi:hypothetical protein